MLFQNVKFLKKFFQFLFLQSTNFKMTSILALICLIKTHILHIRYLVFFYGDALDGGSTVRLLNTLITCHIYDV